MNHHGLFLSAFTNSSLASLNLPSPANAIPESRSPGKAHIGKQKIIAKMISDTGGTYRNLSLILINCGNHPHQSGGLAKPHRNACGIKNPCKNTGGNYRPYLDSPALAYFFSDSPCSIAPCWPPGRPVLNT